ncbi:hypothetical protein GCM10022214_48100 [Actinomadura miaoliensis]|uniref:Uncharacterized protein n=1 Tax=Actinomadura miaoliensis TaxID=430685 RepID=A0ABP7W7K2_9ACTN
MPASLHDLTVPQVPASASEPHRTGPPFSWLTIRDGDLDQCGTTPDLPDAVIQLSQALHASEPGATGAVFQNGSPARVLVRAERQEDGDVLAVLRILDDPATEDLPPAERCPRSGADPSLPPHPGREQDPDHGPPPQEP